MAGLFDMLRSASQAMDAQRYGLDVTGQNIANVNTPGYTRRRPMLSEIPPPDKFTSGSGVRIDGVTVERDVFLERQLRAELPAEQREGALAGALRRVELAIGGSGALLNDRITEFFDSFSRLADAPLSSVARQEVVLRGESLSESFNELSDRLVTAQRDADSQVRATVDDINALATRLASINEALVSIDASSPQALHLRDEGRTTVEELSQLTGAEVVERPDGGYDVSIGNGRALVIGSSIRELSVSSQPVTGLADIVADDGTVLTDLVQSGKLQGLLHARDELIPSYQDSVDDLAYTFVEEVNTLHTSGYDQNGTAGQVFFQALGSSSGAAANVALNAALSATGGEALVAASGDASAVGDNAVARALSNLRDGRVMAGNTATFSDAWSRIVYRVGRDLSAAEDQQATRRELVRQVQALRDGVSGVSMDEEAANLMRFQRAYEANARYFTVVDQTLATLLQMAGV
ncbi:MAG: flagellar hook-associated protein FlgK [Vicinamibacterales bacterium]